MSLTRQAGAAAIDRSSNRHNRIRLLFRKPVSICGLCDHPDQYAPPAASLLKDGGCGAVEGWWGVACVCVCDPAALRCILFAVHQPLMRSLLGVFSSAQAQLRAFIPEMLKYSTGRGKPGWGKESCKPVWWPDDIPWANVRSDVRTEEQKQRVRVGGIAEKILQFFPKLLHCASPLSVNQLYSTCMSTCPSTPPPHPQGVLDAGVENHRQELLQAARPRGPAVRLRGPADHHHHHHHGAAPPPDHRTEHRPPGALADRGADHQQPRRHRVAHPGAPVGEERSSSAVQMLCLCVCLCVLLHLMAASLPLRSALGTQSPRWPTPRSCRV